MDRITLEFKDVEIRHEKGTDNLINSLDIKLLEGVFYWLVGKTGDGKTSIINAIRGDIQFNKGSIFLEGEDIQTIKKQKKYLLHRKVGLISQENRLLNHLTGKENLEFALKSVEYSKKSSEIKDKIEELSTIFGLNNFIQQKLSTLSGGQKQMISIARAMILNPNLILADEACAHLDMDSASKIIITLFNLCKQGKTVLFATHQSKLMERFPGKVLKIENQALIEL